MTEQPTELLPPLAAGDVYVYAHGNGGIGVVYGDGRSLGATLDDALSTAQGAHDAGCRVVVAGDDAPLAVDVLRRLGALGIPLEPFAAPVPPQTWQEGTTALMEAAAHGNDRLLDDLVARGADVHHRDRSGSTALHHAAAAGNLHALDALAAAGADLEGPNTNGFSPLRMALDRGRSEAAVRLEELGATPAAEASRAVRAAGPPRRLEFGRIHFGVVYVWFVVPVLVLVAFALTWPPGVVEVGVVVAFYALVFAFVAPPRPFWAGGVPRAMEGTSLVLRRPTGGLRTLDLGGVTAAATGGSTSATGWHSARWLLLAHPDGHPVTARHLRRLLVPPADLEAFAARAERVVVVPLDGNRSPEVILPVGTLLAARGVELTPTFLALLDRARQQAAPGG